MSTTGTSPSPLEPVRVPRSSPRRSVVASVVWLVLAGLCLLPPQPRPGLAALLLLAAALLIVASRTRSMRLRTSLLVATAAVGVVGSLISPGFAPGAGAGLGPVPLYAAAVVTARLVPWRRTVIVAGAVLTLLIAGALWWVSATGWASLGAISVPFIMASIHSREALRREHARVVALLAELEERRDADVRAAAATERARIARDLHDVLAHTLSGLSLHLQGIRAVLAGRPDTPETVITSVDRAAELARTGLGEARRAVAALREDGPRAPGSGELRALVDGHDGVALDLDDSFDTWEPAVRETAFATVRESLTNAERYAPGARVGVRAGTDEDGARVVRVSDDGASVPITAGDHGGGAGLRGLAERAATVGGTLDARAEPPGWCVELRVPADLPVATGAAR